MTKKNIVATVRRREPTNKEARARRGVAAMKSSRAAGRASVVAVRYEHGEKEHGELEGQHVVEGQGLCLPLPGGEILHTAGHGHVSQSRTAIHEIRQVNNQIICAI